MFFRQVFDPSLAQYAYLIGCQRSGEAVVIDPQRDVDCYPARMLPNCYGKPLPVANHESERTQFTDRSSF